MKPKPYDNKHDEKPYAISVRVGFMRREYLVAWVKGEYDGVLGKTPKLSQDDSSAMTFATKQEARVARDRLRAFYTRLKLYSFAQSVEISDIRPPF